MRLSDKNEPIDDIAGNWPADMERVTELMQKALIRIVDEVSRHRHHHIVLSSSSASPARTSFLLVSIAEEDLEVFPELRPANLQITESLHQILRRFAHAAPRLVIAGDEL